MADIRHRIEIGAPIAHVFDAVATREGLARWWTRDVEGDAALGGELRFAFGSPDSGATMEVVDRTPSRRVVWRCVRGPQEWLGTTVTFDLRTAGDQTALVFTHDGWREPVEFLHHCTTRWGTFLVGLKQGMEGGRFTAWPHDIKTDSWN
jgi:uncharacterized protein YndB with AHSA1/START domain